MFDSGTSLGCDLLTREIPSRAGVRSKPFKGTHAEQIGLVSSLDWVDFDALDAVLPELEAVMDSSGGFIDPARRDALMGFIKSRVDDLRSLC